MLRPFLPLAVFSSTALAASCWRDTVCTGAEEPAFPGPWEDNIFSPASRTPHPSSILAADGTSSPYEDDTIISLTSSAADVVVDFGVGVGGVVSFNYDLSGAESATIGLAFTEAKTYIGRDGDSSRGDREQDGAWMASIHANESHYEMPVEGLRGGFRYLTIFLDDAESDATLSLTDITLEISFQPTWSNLRAYQGYFDSDDELLNRAWYSGAYTVQMDSAPGDTGRQTSSEDGEFWLNNAWITDKPTVLLDGAKRDRWVWIGDMGTAVPSAFLGTGELESSKYALLAIYDNQNSDGVFPKAGPPHVQHDSDTYHLWVLIGTYNYLLYSGDVDFVEERWSNYQAAMDYSLSTLTSDGIVNVQGERDWGRITDITERASASMLLHYALTTGAKVAEWLPSGSEAQAKEYLELAATLKEAIMEQFWDADVGAFSDAPKNTTIHPQDANSIALAYGVVDGDSVEAQSISDYLTSNWTPIGPEAPELPENVAAFIASVELQGHYRAGRPDRALELTRTLWGWYLDHENSTQSTTPEGYRTDGSWYYRWNMEYNGPAYMSHAHCWSSGPTSTLTEYLVGLRVTEPAGKTWVLQPGTFEELAEAQAGFTSVLGKFSAKFTVADGEVMVEWDTPEDTEGVVVLPGMEPKEVGGGKGSYTSIAGLGKGWVVA